MSQAQIRHWIWSGSVYPKKS